MNRSDNDVGSPGRIATLGLPTTPDGRVSVVRSQRAGLSWSGVGNPGGESTSLSDALLSALLSVLTCGVLYVMALVFEP